MRESIRIANEILLALLGGIVCAVAFCAVFAFVVVLYVAPVIVIVNSLSWWCVVFIGYYYALLVLSVWIFGVVQQWFKNWIRGGGCCDEDDKDGES